MVFERPSKLGHSGIKIARMMEKIKLLKNRTLQIGFFVSLLFVPVEISAQKGDF